MSRGDTAPLGPDQHHFECQGQRTAPAERLALAQHGGHGLQQFPPSGCGQAPEYGQVARQPQGLGGLARARGVPGRAQFTAQVGDGAGGGVAQSAGVAAGPEHRLLPARVADARG